MYVRAVRTAIRSLTAVLSFLAMQLSLLGSATGCASGFGGSAATGGAATMAMTMAMPLPATDSGAHDCSTPPGRSHTPAPGDQHCTSMTMCAFALDTPIGMTLEVATSTVPSRIEGISERTPTSSNAAPELPPPRV